MRFQSGTRTAARSVKGLGRKLGIEVRRDYPQRSLAAARMRVLDETGGDLVVDGGAYRGAYGRELRASGFRGKITSYEPQSDAFAALADSCHADEGWCCERLALGDRDGTDEIHLSQDGPTNSLLAADSKFTDHNPAAIPTRTEPVSLRRLDTIVSGGGLGEGALYVKLDVQGSELAALWGAEGCLGRIVAVEIEMSLVPVYQGQPLLVDVVKHLGVRGFSTVRTLVPHYWYPDGTLVQVDGIFTRSA